MRFWRTRMRRHPRTVPRRPCNLLLLGIGDPRAGVVDAEEQTLVLRRERDCDLRPGRRVLDRVRQEILDDSLELGSVDVREERHSVHFNRAIDSLDRVDDPLEERRDVRPLDRKVDEAMAEAVEVEQVQEQPLEPYCLRHELVGHLPARRVVDDLEAFPEREGEAEDRCQGRTQLV